MADPFRAVAIRVTRLERLVRAMLRNEIHSHPAKGEFAGAEFDAFILSDSGIPGYTREGFILECTRQLFKVGNFHQDNSREIAELLADVFYLKPPSRMREETSEGERAGDGSPYPHPNARDSLRTFVERTWVREELQKALASYNPSFSQSELARFLTDFLYGIE